MEIGFEKERSERDSLAASQVMGSGLGYMATSHACTEKTEIPRLRSG